MESSGLLRPFSSISLHHEDGLQIGNRNHRICLSATLWSILTSDLSKYTIGWIAALHIELAAATVMLDERFDKLPSDEQDPTIYTLGRIGGHHVVIACLPGGQTGLSAATAVASRMRNKFRSIEVGFMVGIGGGVPSQEHDIRLGDVVVSLPQLGHGGVVQYDFGKAEADGYFRRTGYLNTPPKLLLNVINEARSRCELGESTHSEHLTRFDHKVALKRFSRSSTGQDMLFQSLYDHVGGSTCEDCKSEMLIERPPRQRDDTSDGDSTVEIHFGTIASGNRVIKDAKTRDKISEQLGGHILCFEMEAAGLMNDFPCLVVRGICDYADSHKQDHWQRYAAATAASYTKELLLLTPSADVSSLYSVKPSDLVPAAEVSMEVPFYVPFDRNPDFVGRGGKLLELDNLMSPLNKRTRAAIWGLGGCGKSAVALEFLYRVHTREPGRAIFWIRASDRDHYKKAFRDIAILYNIPGARDLEYDIMEAVRTKLMNKDTQKWLVVVDNADDPEVLLSGDGPSERRLKDYLPSRTDCKVLFTARDRQAAASLIGISDPLLEVESLDLLEAQQLFRAIVPKTQSTSDDCIKELLTELTFLPLAIVQAAAFIRLNGNNVEVYLKLVREQDAGDESTDVLARDFEDENRYHSKIGNALTRIWHISFDQLHRRNHLAFECLKSMACFGHSDIPEALVTSHVQVSDLEHSTIVGILEAYQFLIRQRQGDLFDTHRLVHLATKRWLWSNHAWAHHVQGAVTTLSQKIPYGGYHEYDKYNRYLPHGICLLDHVNNVNVEESEATTDLLSRIAACQRDLGDYSAAEKSHRAVLHWRQLHLKEHRRKTLQAMQDVGQDLMMRGEYGDAESMHRKTFALRFRYFGPADVETLGSMRNVAEALSFQEKWEEYETLSIELAKLSRAWLGPTHTVTLSSLKALSICYGHRGWFKLAEELAREVVNGRKKAEGLGEKHPSTLKSMSHLALVLIHTNKWTEAEDLESRTSKSLEVILGSKHPDTLTSRCNLARIWVHLNRLPAARELFQEVLETRLSLLGPEHPDTLKSVSYVSRFCKDQHPPKSTRRTSAVLQDPKHLVWTGHENEGDLLNPPSSELSSRTLDSTKTGKDGAPVESTASIESEEAAAKKWSLPWERVDPTNFKWSCKSEHDTSSENIASILLLLWLVDAKESWNWLKMSIPGLRSQAGPVVIPSRPIGRAFPGFRNVAASSHTINPSGPRSNYVSNSIYRAALPSLQNSLRHSATSQPPSTSLIWHPSITFKWNEPYHHLQTFTITAPDQSIILGSDPEGTDNTEPLKDTAFPLEISDDSVSKRHCEIWCANGTWLMRVLDHSNYTHLNDKFEWRGPYKIISGDSLKLGSVTLSVRCDQGLGLSNGHNWPTLR